jgi:secondary thiamine-phosphate synthase enzyme
MAEPKAGTVEQFEVRTPGRGLHEITDLVAAAVRKSGVERGLCTVFIRHTSASLTIQENADASAKRDLEAFAERIAPENEPWYTHTAEGPDDMPSHIRAALTDVSLSVPVMDGELTLGTWQGVYVWEHRTRPHVRKVVVHVG